MGIEDKGGEGGWYAFDMNGSLFGRLWHWVRWPLALFVVFVIGMIGWRMSVLDEREKMTVYEFAPPPGMVLVEEKANGYVTRHYVPATSTPEN
jgi:hypothetical protein